jgi:hypothetical protein
VRSRDDLALGALSPAAPGALLSRCPRLPLAEIPVPVHRPASRCSREAPTGASLDPATAQRLLQLTSDARSHSRASGLRVSRAPRTFAVASNRRSLSPACLGLATFPSRRRITNAANRDSPSEAGPTTLQERRKTRPRKPSSDRNAACGRRLDPTTVCGDGRWTTALDCAGRVALSEGPSLTPPAAAGRRGRRLPSS